MKIRTNRAWRKFRDRQEVPARILKSEFDWCDSVHGFFKYLGTWYHTSQFMRGVHDDWHGSHSDSAFSGVLIRIHEDGDLFQVARFSS